MKQRALDDDAIAVVIDITTRRRTAFAKLCEEFPTNEALAARMNCSLSTINNISRGVLPKGVPRESKVTLDIVLMEYLSRST